jgi:hypothetical protein
MIAPSLSISESTATQFFIADFLIGSDTFWLPISESAAPQFCCQFLNWH